MRSEDTIPDQIERAKKCTSVEELVNGAFRKKERRKKGQAMKLEDVDPKIIEKAKACATAEEVVDMLHKEGIELDDDQLEQISGGGWFGHQCPKCGSYDVDSFSNGRMKCSACGFEG